MRELDTIRGPIASYVFTFRKYYSFQKLMRNSIGQIRMNLNNISTIFQHQIIELKIALFHTQIIFFW